MKVQELTKTEFLKKVANYEASPNKWVYEGDKLDIYKVDTEKEEGLAASFGIRSIPSLLFCPMNGQPQMAKGAMGKADFKKAINEVLLKKE